jgi:hypothetical protein
MAGMWAVATYAVLALVADVVVHVAAVLGFDPQDWVRPDWVAGVGFWGVFVSGFAAGIAVGKHRRRRAEGEGCVGSRHNGPVWFKRLRGVVVVYAVVTVVVCGLRGSGRWDPTRRGDGTYALETGHGRFVQPITAEQYGRYRRNYVRGMSAFVLMFYVVLASDMVYLAGGKGRDAVPGSVRRRDGK